MSGLGSWSPYLETGHSADLALWLKPLKSEGVGKREGGSLALQAFSLGDSPLRTVAGT